MNSNYQSQFNTNQLNHKNDNDNITEITKNLNLNMTLNTESQTQNKINVNNFLKNISSSNSNRRTDIYNNSPMNNYAFSIKEVNFNIFFKQFFFFLEK
jgi:hypothetical protein